MRSSQILIFNCTYGRLFETPFESEGLLRKRVPRKIDAEVAAWRNGRRATNPHSDKYRGELGRMQTECAPRGCSSLVNAQ